MSRPDPDLLWRSEEIGELPMLCWRFPTPLLAVSSSHVGGGIGLRRWILSATVQADYDRPDPAAHLQGLAAGCGLAGPGIGLLTAVDVRELVSTTDGGVDLLATVGIGKPEWAAADPGPDASEASDPPSARRTPVGTINVVAFVPERLSEAALVNAAATITEAKVQAFVDLAIPGTGTATDAVVVACPADGPVQDFGGPRSTWGARLARAAHRAVVAGALADDRLVGRVTPPGPVTGSGVTLADG